MVQAARRLRNTANSFASEQSRSSRHDSIHNIHISAAKKGNDDLLDVTIKKSKKGKGDKSASPKKVSGSKLSQA